MSQLGDIITIQGMRWVISERYEHWQYLPSSNRRCVNPDVPEEEQTWLEPEPEQMEYKSSVTIRCLDRPGLKIETLKRNEVLTKKDGVWKSVTSDLPTPPKGEEHDQEGREVVCGQKSQNGEVIGSVQNTSSSAEASRPVEEV